VCDPGRPHAVDSSSPSPSPIHPESAGLSKLGPLLRAVAADASDHASRLALAEAQVGIDPAAAVDNLLHIVKAAPTWREGAGRITLLKVLDALGPGHPVAISGRKALAKALFR